MISLDVIRTTFFNDIYFYTETNYVYINKSMSYLNQNFSVQIVRLLEECSGYQIFVDIIKGTVNSLTNFHTDVLIVTEKIIISLAKL